MGSNAAPISVVSELLMGKAVVLVRMHSLGYVAERPI